MTTQPHVSFEFFPPKTGEMEEKLWSSIRCLEVLNPAFVSVTYGAGGTTRAFTHHTVKRIREETTLSPAAHLTCVGASRAELDTIIQEYWDAGIRHIVALRGDAPQGCGNYTPHPQGYAQALDLMAGIKRIGNFDISVAAFPEKHPDSPSFEQDIEILRRKADAGAVRAITQYFFDNEHFFRLRDRVAAAGITLALVPGIVPIGHFGHLKKFSAMCGATIPAWLEAQFDGLDGEPAARDAASILLATRQCEALIAEGVDLIHFYTLNRADLTQAVCRNIGIA